MERIGGGYAEFAPSAMEHVQAMRVEADELRRELAVAQAERNLSRGELDQLADELCEERSHSAAAASELGRLQAIVDASRSLRQQKEDTHSELRAELRTMGEQLQQSQSELAMLRGAFEGKDEEAERTAILRVKLAGSEQQLASCQRELQAATLQGRGDAAAAAAAAAAREQEKRAREAEWAELSSARDNEQRAWELERAELRSQLAGASDGLAEARSRLEAVEAEAREARRAAAAAQAAEMVAAAQVGREARERLSAAEWEGALSEAQGVWAAGREQLVNELQATRAQQRALESEQASAA